MNITVHHLEFSRSTRALFLLEELGVDYEIVRHKRNKGGRAIDDDLRKVHPLGRAPMVVVDGKPLVESAAILEWFVEDSGIEGASRLGPPSRELKQDYRFFLHYGEGSVMPVLIIRLLMERVKTAPLPFFIKPIARRVADGVQDQYSNGEIARHFDFLDDWLSTREWLLGDTFTAADIHIMYPVAAAKKLHVEDRPHVRAWWDRLAARPAFKRAIEKGGPLTPPR